MEGFDASPGEPPFEPVDGRLFIPREGSLAELLMTRGAPLDEERWACDNVWKPGSLTLVVGAQQSFKSWAMFDLMYHAAKGTNWLDRSLTDYDSIVYVSNEKSYTAIYERLWLLFERDLPLADRIYVRHREHRIHFGNEHWAEFQRWLQDDVPGKRVLLILDTLTSLAPAGYDENNLKDVSKVLGAIRDLQQGSRLDTLLVHHLNALGERPRGHTALDGEVDGFVKFDRRGRDLDEVLVKFEPKDGLPTVGTFTFDPAKGMFKRATARALHIGNLVSIIQWWQDRNSGEGMTLKDLKERFFNGYRTDQLEVEVGKAVDALVLKRELKRSLLTNREANLISVMTDEEREVALRLKREVDYEEGIASARATAEIRSRDLLERKGRAALAAMPEPLFSDA